MRSYELRLRQTNGSSQARPETGQSACIPNTHA